MSVYLGNQCIGVAHTVTDIGEGNEILTAQQKADLNDAVGYRTNNYATRSVSQIIEELNKTYGVNETYTNSFVDFENTVWVRPQDWPDLDSLNLQMSGNDFIYMTYDNKSSNFGAVSLHIEKTSGGTNIEVTMGHIENGTYIPDETITGSNNNYYRWFTNNDPDYPVVRITGSIYYCYCIAATDANGAIQHQYKQPILERIAYVPNLKGFCASYSSNIWGSHYLQREKINNGDGSKTTSLYYAWAYCQNLRDLDISGLKTQNVASMQYTFSRAYKIKTLDLKHFNVAKVTNFSGTFSNARALLSVDCTGWDTSAATTMTEMFSNCYGLKEVKGLANFNTAKVTSFSNLFLSCYSLEEINVSSWNTEKITTLANAFNTCESITELDLSNWDVSLVTNLGGTFKDCHSLKVIKFPAGPTGTLTTINSLFYNCYNLQKIDLSWFTVTSSCTSIYAAFYNCWSVKELNFPTWNVSGLGSGSNTANSIFAYCYSLEKITGISNWNFQFSNSLASIFYNCFSLKELNVSGWNVSTVTSLASVFYNCYSLQSLDVSAWRPTACKTFDCLFYGCRNLTSVGNIGSWDTSNITIMSAMFRYCWSLKEMPNIKNWTCYPNVTSMAYLFQNCFSFKEIIWPNLNLPKCTSIANLCEQDYNLKKADLSNWSIPLVTNQTSYYGTLSNCFSLEEIVGFPIPDTYTNVGFKDCIALSRESVLLILNSLPQKTGSGWTVRIPANSLNQLTTAEKAIATNKNWTLANS